MKTEIEVLNDIAQKLDSLNIPYMLTGSLAMSYYAIPRMTRDIDIVIELNTNNMDSFVNIFKDEYYLSEEAILDSIKQEFIFNLIEPDSSIKIDFIIRKGSEFRKIEFERRVLLEISGNPIYLVSKEDLIISKLFWFSESDSEMQKRDIKNLLNSGYDEDYLIYWINKLNLTEYFQKV
jgi:hypothetical protein